MDIHEETQCQLDPRGFCLTHPLCEAFGTMLRDRIKKAWEEDWPEADADEFLIWITGLLLPGFLNERTKTPRPPWSHGPIFNLSAVITELQPWNAPASRFVWYPGGARPGEYAMITPAGEQLKLLQPIIDQGMSYFPDRIRGMTLLSRLIPGQRIDPHCDHHDGDCNVRVHVPLITNPQAVFVTEGVEMHMEVGWAYAIDPTKPHSAYNGGTTDRIHLMFNARKP